MNGMHKKKQNKKILCRRRISRESKQRNKNSLSPRYKALNFQTVRRKEGKRLKTQKLDGFRGFENSVFVFASLSHI